MKLFVVSLMLLATLCIAQEEIQCGTKGVGNQRIVGGNIARKNSWPWQITIKRKRGFHFCGGSIIKPNWIVTAAHCIQANPRAADYIVTAGEHNLRRNESDEKEFELEKIIKHEEYNETSGHRYDYDVALLKLKGNITYDDKIRPVCLKNQSFPTGTNCTVTGWGRLNESSSRIPSRLRQAVVPLVSHRDCQRAYHGVTERMLCAGYPQGGVDACFNDSGGPLVCKNRSGAFELVGVVSWGIGCARRRKYGVYANMDKLTEWVETNVENN
ncbi:trypsin-3 [Exaiptasia diaphana]|uniref:Peptidase S1 domain-containing protein n=1 Tax=Exaiptasia diaphana TaxID=2652724 RepID=A0A913XZE3_EXADI|nr:trypsin-3 [Exaiptasia diaphana]